MGVDYKGVGGVGVFVTDEIVDKFIEAGLFTREDWEDDEGACLDNCGFTWSSAGSYYSDDSIWYYLQVPGETLLQLNNNVDSFITSLRELGVSITIKDIVVIEDLLIY